MKQAIVIDTETGKYYHTNPMRQYLHSEGECGPLLGYFGNVNSDARVGGCVGGSGTNYYRIPLTPLPDDHPEVLYRKLGKAIYELVPKEHRGRITGEFRSPADRESHWDVKCDEIYEDYTPPGGVIDGPAIILSPLPEPKGITVTIDGSDTKLSRHSVQELFRDLQKAARAWNP